MKYKSFFFVLFFVFSVINAEEMLNIRLAKAMENNINSDLFTLSATIINPLKKNDLLNYLSTESSKLNENNEVVRFFNHTCRKIDYKTFPISNIEKEVHSEAWLRCNFQIELSFVHYEKTNNIQYVEDAISRIALMNLEGLDFTERSKDNPVITTQNWACSQIEFINHYIKIILKDNTISRIPLCELLLKMHVVQMTTIINEQRFFYHRGVYNSVITLDTVFRKHVYDYMNRINKNSEEYNNVMKIYQSSDDIVKQYAISIFGKEMFEQYQKMREKNK